MTVRAAIITAAGSGVRLGHPVPKALVHVNGVPMLVRSVWPFAAFDHVVVTAPPSHHTDVADALRAHGLSQVQVVVGGDTRAQSVAQGLAAVPAEADVVLVHDAARPFLPTAVIDRVLAALAAGELAVVPVVPVTDSLKQVRGGHVVEHTDRAAFAGAQTPQGFAASALREAYARAAAAGTLSNATDDVSVTAAAGLPVAVVDGDPRNIKITTPADLPATDLAATGSEADLRSGFATDVHAFADSGQLSLAGLVWPEHPALAGHSDGDAAIHALCDALLSACGLGDLGSNFGTSEPRWAGAASIRLLEHTVELMAGAGWTCVSAQVQVIGNRPRLAPRREQAQDLLTSVVGVPVFLSATTTDGLGFTGRGEGIAATAAVLVRRGSVSDEHASI